MQGILGLFDNMEDEEDSSINLEEILRHLAVLGGRGPMPAVAMIRRLHKSDVLRLHDHRRGIHETLLHTTVWDYKKQEITQALVELCPEALLRL